MSSLRRATILSAITAAVLFLLAASPSIVKAQDLPLDRYIENPAMVAENQEAPHVVLLPAGSAEDARTLEEKNSPFVHVLDGRWDFKWLQNPSLVPEGFYQPDYDTQDWSEIAVPSSWQTQGFGHPMYRNIPQALHPYDPPRVPDDHNGTGLYRCSFHIPASWDGRQVFLHFEGVKSGSFVYINGAYVGFDKGGMTPAEYDVTDFVEPGENLLAVKVIRWTDGSYLDDQDMWRLAGIHRSVYLYSTPRVQIRDLYVTTPFDAAGDGAVLRAEIALRNATEGAANSSVDLTLFDAAGDQVAQASASASVPPGEEELVVELPVERPDRWSAEHPVLYTLVLELNADEMQHVVRETVGFREMTLIGGQALINGYPVTFKGVNRHEHSPELGRTVPEALMLKDIELMKQHNVNAVRHSHYPNDPEWYDLADQFGLYLQDEVNVECHADERLPREDWPLGRRLSDIELYAAQMMDRWIHMIAVAELAVEGELLAQVDDAGVLEATQEGDHPHRADDGRHQRPLVGRGEHLRRAADHGGAGGAIVLVADADAVRRAGLDHHRVAMRRQLAHACGHQADPVLLGLDLLGDADAHFTLPSDRRCVCLSGPAVRDVLNRIWDAAEWGAEDRRKRRMSFGRARLPPKDFRCKWGRLAVPKHRLPGFAVLYPAYRSVRAYSRDRRSCSIR